MTSSRLGRWAADAPRELGDDRLGRVDYTGAGDLAARGSRGSPSLAGSLGGQPQHIATRDACDEALCDLHHCTAAERAYSVKNARSPFQGG